MKRVDIWDSAVNIRAGISLVDTLEVVSRLSIRSQESELSRSLVNVGDLSCLFCAWFRFVKSCSHFKLKLVIYMKKLSYNLL